MGDEVRADMVASNGGPHADQDRESGVTEPIASWWNMTLHHLRDVFDKPGPWGKVIAGIITLWWAIALIDNSATLPENPLMVPVLIAVPRLALAAWMLAVALMPFVAIASGQWWLRQTVSTCCAITWFVFSAVAMAHGRFAAQSTGSFLAALVAYAYADYSVMRTMARKR